MAADRYKGPERRACMRLDVDCVVDYIKLSKGLKPLRKMVDDGYSKNISACGMKFMTSEKIPIGSFLELHIRIRGVNKPLTAVAKVLRCDPERKRDFGVSVSFIWINKKDRKLIDEYVKNKSLDILRSKIKE